MTGRPGSTDAAGGPALAAAERMLVAACGLRARTSFPMAPLTSFRIGGPAALYLEAETDGDLSAVAETVRATGIAWTVVGKGSNLLVSDRGFAGLVVRLGKSFRWVGREGDLLRAGGAMPLPALSGVAAAHSLAGLEFGVAIPASLGGAVRMNAGAHHHSMDEVLERIELYSVAEASRMNLPAAEARFRYRDSELPPDSIVVGAIVRLVPGEPAEIRRRMQKARDWRRATQPLAEPNCGSVFKNPPGDHAARLVEEVGGKGMSMGGAAVSRKHSNFIVVNPESASASDVLRLIRLIQQRVEERFGLVLEEEVQLVGEFDLASI
jgi:UDP-N-acetylmuramate dehydrogenase